MKRIGMAARLAVRTTAVMLVATFAAGPARAQVGIGIAYPGVPMLFYTPQQVPSPSDYLHQREQERISAFSNAAQQQAAASQMAGASGNPNAYFNRIRSYSGEETYDVRSRQSLSRRASPPAEPVASRPATQPLDAYFLPSGTMDWPRDAPDSAALRSAQAEVEAAVQVVRQELRSSGKARAQSVGAAKFKLVNYGQQALQEVKSTRSDVVADLFHYFLLFLHQSLDAAPGTRVP